MIGEVAGTEDFATRTRISGQRNAADQMLQPGQWTAGNCLNLKVAGRLPDTLLSRLPGLGSNRGRHEETLRKLPGQTSLCSSLPISRKVESSSAAPDTVAARKALLLQPKVASERSAHIIPTMSTVTEVEKALEKFSPEQMREVADWIAARLLPDESPEQLAAIDAGLRSLRTEPTLNAEQVRQNIRAWVAR
jgi:hypothetical protein